MASQRFDLQRLSATHRKNVRLEEELAPAVLEAGAALLAGILGIVGSVAGGISRVRKRVARLVLRAAVQDARGQQVLAMPGAVRHAPKVRAEREDGSTRTYVCLCTRCLVAEEALAKRVLYRVAGQWVEKRRTSEKAARRQRRKQAA